MISDTSCKKQKLKGNGLLREHISLYDFPCFVRKCRWRERQVTRATSAKLCDCQGVLKGTIPRQPHRLAASSLTCCSFCGPRGPVDPKQHHQSLLLPPSVCSCLWLWFHSSSSNGSRKRGKTGRIRSGLVHHCVFFI